MLSFKELRFDQSYGRLPSAFYQNIAPGKIDHPYLISINDDVASLVNLDVNERKSLDFVQHICGQKLIPGTKPLSAIYAGYDFGQFTEHKGNGRSVSLAEAVNEDGSRWEIQLKGSHAEFFSRVGDGRMMLRSAIREFLCSELMHKIGIPTTRSLCITGFTKQIPGEMLEPSAALTRIAPTHVRFGTFEHFHHSKQRSHIKTLADYLLNYYFKEIDNSLPNKYEQLFRKIVVSTAQLIAKWQAAGFTHGIMNTDNMSIMGLTMDYSRFGFLDKYNPNYASNGEDIEGRYRFKQQPHIALWNLTRLTEPFTALISVNIAKELLEKFDSVYASNYIHLMLQKTGLVKNCQHNILLIQQILDLLEQDEVDYTLFFRRLSEFDCITHTNNIVRGLFTHREAFDNWAYQYAAQLRAEKVSPEKRKEQMDKINPKYVLRNYFLEKAVERAETGDFSEIDKLQQILSNPFDEQVEYADYAQPPPDWEQMYVDEVNS